MVLHKTCAVILAVALLSTGCLKVVSLKDPDSVADAVEVDDDEFSRNVTFSAPSIRSWAPPAPYEAALVALRDKDSGVLRHRLAVRWKYTKRHWLYLDNPTLSGGVRLPTEKMHKTNRCANYGCERVEALISEIPDGFLENTRDGFRVRYDSEVGYIVVDFPQAYVTGYLTGIAEKSDFHEAAPPPPKRPAQRSKGR
jgi:hypothetical protein